MSPLIDTSSDPALKASDSSTSASHDASDKQYKKASLCKPSTLLSFFFFCSLRYNNGVIQLIFWQFGYFFTS